MRSTLVFIIAFLYASLVPLAAQDSVQPIDSAAWAQIDSAMQALKAQQQQRAIGQIVAQTEAARMKRETSFRFDGLQGLTRGLLLSWTDHHFIQRPAIFAEKTSLYTWTDYGVAGLPMATAWVLKAAGVKSRSHLQRMLTANAMALAISVGTTQLLKHTINETRPDQTDNHSFPSGHTSFAFVSAAILSREYGHLSPWVTVGSYGAATATQLLRVAHNRHWLNDLYVGAGIGAISTNLAYFLTDRIFGTDAINPPEVRRRDILRLMRFSDWPSGFSFVTGSEVGNRTVHFDDGAMLKAGAALTAGADLSWFFHPNFALEGIVRGTSAQLKMYDVPSSAISSTSSSSMNAPTSVMGTAVDVAGASSVFTGDVLYLYHFDLALKASTPFALGKRLSSRVMAGTRIMTGASLTNGITTYEIPREIKFELGCGLNFYVLDTENYAWGFTADLFHTFSHYLPTRYSFSSVWKILF